MLEIDCIHQTSNKEMDFMLWSNFQARDNFVFLERWLVMFPQYKNRDFYITGESYAGMFISD